MWRGIGRAATWLAVYERPVTRGEVWTMIGLVMLVVAGAVALAWPWLTDDAPRMVAAGLSVVWVVLMGWWRAVSAAVSRAWPW